MEIKCLQSGALGVNTYYVRDEETNEGYIVDPGGYSQRLESLIKEDGCKIRYIILTHGHGDHIGGVESYKNLYNCPVVASELEKELLADPYMNASLDCCGRNISMAADIWVKDCDSLKVGNMELKFLSTPGHTPGGMCIYTGDVVFSGDTLFQMSVGRTDFPGGSYPQLQRSIKEKLFVLPDDTRVYPGHMGSTNIGLEKRSNPFV